MDSISLILFMCSLIGAVPLSSQCTVDRMFGWTAAQMTRGYNRVSLYSINCNSMMIVSCTSGSSFGLQPVATIH